MSLLWVVARDQAHGLPQHVRAEDIPTEGTSSTDYGTVEGQWAPAFDDHPYHHLGVPTGKTYSLRHEPLSSIMPGLPGEHCPGGRHGAHCYSPDHEEGWRGHDVSEGDEDYVRGMIPAAKEHRLPAFVQGAGGGHRLAALYDAGESHYYIWRPDNQKREWGEGLDDRGHRKDA